jgi:hypothetical protein
MKASCIICLEAFKSGAEMCVIGCGHVYHHSCIIRWFSRNAIKRCPQCQFSTGLNSVIRRLYLNEEVATNDQDLAESVKRLREENDSLKYTVRQVILL